MATLYQYVPNRVIDQNGIADGASIFFYQSGTTTLITIYSDEAATTPVSNPIVVGAGAGVPNVYWTFSGDVRVLVQDDSGATIDDVDPYSPLGSFTPADTGSVTRSIADRLADTLHVDDFDGVDDTARIKAALTAASARATTNGHCTLVFQDRDYTVDVEQADFQSTAGWRVLFTVGDNLTLKGRGRIVSTTPFASRCVIFSVRGDNITIDGLRGEDLQALPIGNAFAVFVGWGNEYDDSLSSKTYTNLTVKNCELVNHWLSISCQTNSGTNSRIDGVRLFDNKASRADSVTSAGCYNFRSEDPGDIANVDCHNNVGKNGPTAAVFNFFGVHGVTGSGNTQLGSTVYAGMEVEKGVTNAIWDGFRSESEGVGIWIDQCDNVEIGNAQIEGDIRLTSETGVIDTISITGGLVGGIEVPEFGSYVDGVIQNVFIKGVQVKGSGTHAVLIQGVRIGTTGSITLRDVDVSPASSFTNHLTVVRNANMGALEVSGGNLDSANFNFSGMGGTINIGASPLSGGTARTSMAPAASGDFIFNLPSTGATSVRGGRLLFVSRDASGGGGGVFEALYSISREGAGASVTIGGAINAVGDADAVNVALSGSVNTDGSELTVNVTNNSSSTLQLRGFCEVTRGTSGA